MTHEKAEHCHCCSLASFPHLGFPAQRCSAVNIGPSPPTAAHIILNCRSFGGGVCFKYEDSFEVLLLPYSTPACQEPGTKSSLPDIMSWPRVLKQAPRCGHCAPSTDSRLIASSHSIATPIQSRYRGFASQSGNSISLPCLGKGATRRMSAASTALAKKKAIDRVCHLKLSTYLLHDLSN